MATPSFPRPKRTTSVSSLSERAHAQRPSTPSTDSPSAISPNFEATSTGHGPQILRPIPRRPFGVGPGPTSPKEDTSVPGTPDTPGPSITAHDLRFLDPRRSSGFQLNTLSRETSFMNLTKPALFGIYSSAQDQDEDDRAEPTSPWGTGSHTPARGLGGIGVLDEQDRPQTEDQQPITVPSRRRDSYVGTRARARSASPESNTPSATPSTLAIRGLVLFAMGVGYGVVVTRLPSRQNFAAFGVDNITLASPHWGYLAFWGCAACVLGVLLPWLDGVLERAFGTASTEATADKDAGKSTSTNNRRSPESDWAAAVRGIGVFIGIVFAIRRLTWTSTMQVSLCLLLANPFLWYLIDRTRSGLLFSTAIGLAGSAILMSLVPDIMPTPTALLAAQGLRGPNATTVASVRGSAGGGGGAFEDAVEALAGVSGLGSVESVESGVWILSVLFCSCVCFGNIGRRLALSSGSGSGSGKATAGAR